MTRLQHCYSKHEKALGDLLATQSHTQILLLTSFRFLFSSTSKRKIIASAAFRFVILFYIGLPSISPACCAQCCIVCPHLHGHSSHVWYTWVYFHFEVTDRRVVCHSIDLAFTIGLCLAFLFQTKSSFYHGDDLLPSQCACVVSILIAAVAQLTGSFNIFTNVRPPCGAATPGTPHPGFRVTEGGSVWNIVKCC